MLDRENLKSYCEWKDKMMGEFTFYDYDIMLEEADGFHKTYERLELEDERMMYGDDED